MNRSERRAAARKGLDADQLKQLVEHNTVTGYHDGYQDGYKKGFEEGSAHAIETSVESFSVAILYVMSYKLNYGEKKCHMTMKQIADTFHKLHSKEMDIDTLKEELEQRAGVKFVNEP